jgi:nucleoside-diphosphate-sugar epimerase
MRVVIAGGHGQVARRLGRLLTGQGHSVVGLIRREEQQQDLRSDGVEPHVIDLESASVAEVAEVLGGADAAVFAAGAGPGSGAARKETVDFAASVLLADAAERAGVPYLLQVSAMGLDRVPDADDGGGQRPPGLDDVFLTYLQAKQRAEQDLRRRDGLRWAILRPGGLTDEPGTGRVRLDRHVERGSIPRDDVAAVLAAMLAAGVSGVTWELVGGETPVEEAVAGGPRHV